MEAPPENRTSPLKRGSGGWSFDASHVSTTVPGYKEAPDTGRISPVRNMETPSGPVEVTNHR